jgi:hypothetical protein
MYLYVCSWLSCINKESEERDFLCLCFLNSAVSRQAGRAEREREKETKKRKIQKSDKKEIEKHHQNFFSKKKREVFFLHTHARVSLLARADERVNST